MTNGFHRQWRGLQGRLLAKVTIVGSRFRSLNDPIAGNYRARTWIMNS